ncbi:hypothetical protein D3C75_1109520 [compost metagenome]
MFPFIWLFRGDINNRSIRPVPLLYGSGGFAARRSAVIPGGAEPADRAYFLWSLSVLVSGCIEAERHFSVIQIPHLAILGSLREYMIEKEGICYFAIITPD